MVLPYQDSPKGKKQQVRLMFNNIAARYDFLNRLLSFSIDRFWRKKAISLLRDLSPRTLLDVATGTGDLALEAHSLRPEKIIGTDISEAMLAIALRKVKRKKMEHLIGFVQGDAENLPFEESDFDAVVTAFGVRNFEDIQKGIDEMFRVLRSGGQVVVLELSKPLNPVFSGLYRFYFTQVLPAVGRWVSNDRSAYRYLPDSLYDFPDRESFVAILEAAGFKKCRFFSFTMGIASIYTGFKP